VRRAGKRKTLYIQAKNALHYRVLIRAGLGRHFVRL
jgi:hypothetical protein